MATILNWLAQMGLCRAAKLVRKAINNNNNNNSDGFGKNILQNDKSLLWTSH